LSSRKTATFGNQRSEASRWFNLRRNIFLALQDLVHADGVHK
jgi:hypothetical protein